MLRKPIPILMVFTPADYDPVISTTFQKGSQGKQIAML